MNMRFSFWLLIFAMSLVTACQSDDDKGPQAGEEIQVVTGKGTPTGDAVSKTIGADGGTLQSADGQLVVDVPAGALSTATQISIQPISNEAPLGVGSGYRLQPEGIKFSKPVKLTFTYSELALNGTVEDFLWVVTQASDGHWGAMMNSEVNKEANTVTVEAKHFSDWTIGKFINLSLTPSVATLKKNESLSLGITGFSADGPELDELVPLGPMPASSNEELEVLTPLVPGTALIRFKVKNWTLNGTTAPVSNSNGSLSPSNKTATYTAPGVKPSRNPVAVSVTLEDDASVGLGSYMLTSNISIVENDLFLSVVVDGQSYEYYQYGFNGIIPPDPTDMYIANCGHDDDGLQLGGTHVVGDGSEITASFILNIEAPEGKFIGSKKFACTLDDGSDDAVFGLSSNPGQNMISRYTKRSKNKDVCNSEDFCSDFYVTLDKYEETGNAIGPYRVHGIFYGTLYSEESDYEDRCKSSDPHTISGEFNLVVAN